MLPVHANSMIAPSTISKTPVPIPMSLLPLGPAPNLGGTGGAPGQADFFAGAFFAAAFFAGAFLAGAFLAGAFLAGVFFAGASPVLLPDPEPEPDPPARL